MTKFTFTPEPIPMEKLVKGAWYMGEGRFVGDVAYWNGSLFVGLGMSFNNWEANMADYGETGFTPLFTIILPPYKGGNYE